MYAILAYSLQITVVFIDKYMYRYINENLFFLFNLNERKNKKYAIVSKNFTRCIEMYSCVCKNIKLAVKHTSTTDHHVSKSVIYGTVLITSCHCPVTGIQQDKF